MPTRNKIAIGTLLILAVFLFHLIITESFIKYTNCNYLIVNHLELDPFFCNGYTVKFMETTIFTIPGLKDVIDPQLEIVRLVTAWCVVLFFAFISLCLTIIINNLKTIGKLILCNKDEWIKFMTSVRIWLLLFVVFCTGFYFIGIK